MLQCLVMACGDGFSRLCQGIGKECQTSCGRDSWGPSSFSEPAAAFRGLANSASSASMLSRFNSSKDALGIYTSPNSRNLRRQVAAVPRESCGHWPSHRRRSPHRPAWPHGPAAHAHTVTYRQAVDLQFDNILISVLNDLFLCSSKTALRFIVGVVDTQHRHARAQPTLTLSSGLAPRPAVSANRG